jgi:sortase A
MLIATGLFLVTAVAAWQVYASVWTAHSERVGRSLVHRFLQNHSLSNPVHGSGQTARTASLASCGSPAADGPVKGLLEIPKLGMTAPVEQGTDDPQLDVAVGHDPYSVWPGTAGNSVLEAHDVSWFQNLPELSAGDQVVYESPCTTYFFQVQGHSIVQQGAPVYNTPGPTLTLVTCWPTDALWFTPDRYLVTASIVSSRPTTSNHTYLAASGPPQVPVPAALASQGVTLATYSLPMGTFTLNGQPDPAWAQTTTPLMIEDAGVEAFIAGVKALTENQLGWWSAIAPGVPAPTPLVGADNPRYESQLDVTVTAQGTTATSVSLSDTLYINGGRAPGAYSTTVQETVHGDTLVISSWTMHRA